MKHSPCLAAALACFAAAAFAQTPSSRDIYMYQGADREARLVAGAKKERQEGLYSTLTVAHAKAPSTPLQQEDRGPAKPLSRPGHKSLRPCPDAIPVPRVAVALIEIQ